MSCPSATCGPRRPRSCAVSSGTTGKPKSIVHTHAGGLVQPANEIFVSFDHKPADRFFWVSDIGWMMGPWTLIGNHAHGGTVFMYEGAPDYPEPDRFWEMIDTHNLSVFGISPTAIRSLQKHGDEWLEGHDLSTLRLLGSTGEPWDPDSWEWFLENVGDGTSPLTTSRRNGDLRLFPSRRRCTREAGDAWWPGARHGHRRCRCQGEPLPKTTRRGIWSVNRQRRR